MGCWNRPSVSFHWVTLMRGPEMGIWRPAPCWRVSTVRYPPNIEPTTYIAHTLLCTAQVEHALVDQLAVPVERGHSGHSAFGQVWLDRNRELVYKVLTTEMTRDVGYVGHIGKWESGEEEEEEKEDEEGIVCGCMCLRSDAALDRWSLAGKYLSEEDGDSDTL